MEWMTCIKDAIEYMEQNLLTITGPEEVADHVHISGMYLQRGFHILTGYSMGEYIRNRRLYLAAKELMTTDIKIIDLAFKYGYETPESFTKAFRRFHNATPLEIRKEKTSIQPFLPLRVQISIQGGNHMNCTVERMNEFQVIGFVREFKYDTAYQEIPKFWDEVFGMYAEKMITGKAPTNEVEQAFMDHRIGEFGVSIDDLGMKDRFRYMIAGRYLGGKIPEGMEVYQLPQTEWAKFQCMGPMPEALQTINTQIWQEWLPGNTEYELSGQYSIEWYSSSMDTKSPNYESAIWLPVKRK